MKRLLLLSNSINPGEKFFNHALPFVKDFLEGTDTAMLLPFAGIRFTFDHYTEVVTERFKEIGIAISSLHHAKDPIAAIGDAKAIIVGGGNTFHLLKECYERNVLDAIRKRVDEGVPYVGWSAGSVLACPTIMTTNDMPIVEPPSLKSLGLVPFQINAHYTSESIPGHGGETRDERLAEYISVNQETNVVGLREGTMLRIEGDTISLLGAKPLRLFRYGKEPAEYSGNINFLLE